MKKEKPKKRLTRKEVLETIRKDFAEEDSFNNYDEEIDGEGKVSNTLSSLLAICYEGCTQKSKQNKIEKQKGKIETNRRC